MVQNALLMVADAKSFANQPLISEVDGYLIERKSLKNCVRMKGRYGRSGGLVPEPVEGQAAVGSLPGL